MEDQQQVHVEDQQQVQNVPTVTAGHQTRIHTRTVPKEIHSREDLRRVTRAMTNTKNTRSKRTRYDLRDNPPKKTYADSLFSQMSIKDTSKLQYFSKGNKHVSAARERQEFQNSK